MIRAFNATADEVRHILANETGQAWRPAKPQPRPGTRPYGMRGKRERTGWTWKDLDTTSRRTLECALIRAAPYQPGDVLWVREAWLVAADMDGYSTFYRADGEDIPGPWHYSITMPRKHSRIDIEITAVAAKQVRAVTGDDAIAAGCFVPNHGSVSQVFINRFRERWNSLYAQRGLGWAINPWAWVFDWRRIKP